MEECVLADVEGVLLRVTGTTTVCLVGFVRVLCRCLFPVRCGCCLGRLDGFDEVVWKKWRENRTERCETVVLGGEEEALS